MTDRFDRFTERARKALTYAHQEAQRLQHNYIGTEHLLLGLIREDESAAARVLAGVGVELERTRAVVERIIGRGDRLVMGGLGLTPRTKKVIELAVGEARDLGHDHVGSEHLLLGIVREGEGIAAGVLASLGVSLDRVRAEVLRVLSQSAAFVESGVPLEQLDDQARDALTRAEVEASRRGHEWVGAEHAVLALLAEDGPVAEVLRDVGLDLAAARERLGVFLGPDAAEPPAERLETSPNLRVAVASAARRAIARQQHPAGTVDLLLLLLEGDQVAQWLLTRLGAPIETLWPALLRRLDRP